MDAGLIVGIISAVAVLVLLWPAVQRAGPTALPALLFWALAIAAVTALVMLVQQWTLPAPPPVAPPLAPQRGTVT
jgi:hypothetical protein